MPTTWTTPVSAVRAVGDERAAAPADTGRGPTPGRLPPDTAHRDTAHPDTVDAVFRKILRKRDFTWAEHGEALMRRRKA